MQSGVFAADIGTSSLKAAFITADGTVLYTKRIFFSQPVHAADWVSAFFSAWIEAAEKYIIEALCISGNGPTLVGVCNNYSGIPAGTATQARSLFSSCVDRAKDDVLFLWNEAITHTTTLHTASLFIPRLFAFKTAYPAVWDKCCRILCGPEYVMYILTGNAVTVLPEVRYKKAYWDAAALQEWNLSIASLAPFVLLGTEIGQFCGVPVIAGGPDFIAALIGTNTLHAGAACDRAGSSEGINICIQKPCFSQKTLLLPSIMPNTWNVSFLVPDSGSTFAQFAAKEGFVTADYNLYMKKIVNEPFRQIENYPETSAGRGRTFIEKLGFYLRSGFDCIEQCSGYTPIYTLSGGQSKNPLWCQLKADITGRSFAAPHCADAELLGNAALALYHLDFYPSLPRTVEKISTITHVYEPEPRNAALYSEKYASIYKKEAYSCEKS